MTDAATLPDDRGHRARVMNAAGIGIVVLSAGSALLPFLGDELSGRIVGILLILAGVLELVAARLRHEARVPASLAGGATLLVGLFLSVAPLARPLPAVYAVIAWLLAHAILLFWASGVSHGGVRRWSRLSAAIDVALAALLAAGLPVATLIIGLFGTTPPLIATFAWVFAISLVVTGMLMIEIAGCLADDDA